MNCHALFKVHLSLTSFSLKSTCAFFCRFAIKFQTGQSDTDDIAFHFSPCIGQNVFLNSFRSGSWEKEETASDKPFTKGATFNMLVIINSEGYEVCS